ncbi:hypothetical protein MVEN_00774300 [Mycena venus]|uniref:F-box domain-containing protein n=1 Tax=Mycena venus TaxID=2733690 RepID=A0A8H6YLH9_9AGAR|nr:hypothetical protein MVEN_00774300 [Mycena venus]
MHRCLKVTELLDLIFSYLEPFPLTLKFLASHLDDNFERRHTSDLIVLACTCTIFNGPALDIIWRTQTTLQNLLRCMPHDLFTIVRNNNKRTMTLCRPIVAADWDRALVYAQRVRNFGFCVNEAQVSLSAIFPALASSLPGDKIFPNLIHLQWSPEADSDFPYLRLFLAQTVTDLSISCMGSSSNASLFTAFALQCPKLTRVKVNLKYKISPPSDTDASHTDASPILSEFTRHLEFVEDLGMSILDFSVIPHIARSRTLRSLQIAELHNPPPYSSPPLAVPLSFIRLDQLRLENVSVDAASGVLRLSTDAPLQTLSIGLHERLNIKATEVVYDTLGKCTRSQSSLTMLMLFHREVDSSGMHDGYMISSRAMQHLFSLGNLVRVLIHSPCGFDLDDALVARMARAWPQVELLELRESVAPAKQPITVDCLRSFAQYCPRLRNLHMTFNACFISSNTTVAVVPQSSLSCLKVAHSRLSSRNAMHVAQFLVSIFPRLACVEAGVRYNEDDSDESAWERRQGGWDEVQYYVQEIQLHAAENAESSGSDSDSDILGSTSTVLPITRRIGDSQRLHIN